MRLARRFFRAWRSRWGVSWFALWTIRYHSGASLLVNAILGALCGLLYGVLLQRQLTRSARQLYDGTSRWMRVPPGEFSARMMCRMMWGRTAVGGHLYVGREAWVFMPHTKNQPVDGEAMRWDQPGTSSSSPMPSSLFPSYRKS